MTINKLSQKGASHLIAIVTILVLAGVGFAGWRVMNMQDSNDNSTSTSEVQEEIKDEQDLQKVEDTLNESDLDADLDTSDLDAAELDLQ